jgi:ubiquitin-conjugating enzyme E2 J1
MLEAIISFLPSEGAGAIGALDWSAEERKKLAIEVSIETTLSHKMLN